MAGIYPWFHVMSLLALIALLLAVPTPPAHAATNYYIDCSRTTDGNGSSGSPWNSFIQPNSFTFSPGDSLLLKRTTSCQGMLWPQGSGSSGAAITIGAYGSGSRPIINGGDNAAALKLFEQQYWHIENLEVRGGNPRGISISGNTPDTALNHFRITNVLARDVGGYAEDKGSGLVVLSASGDGQTINDVVIDNVTAYNTQQWAGIAVFGGGGWNGEATARGEGITIRNSTVYNVAGDGIIIYKARNSLIEHNLVYNVGDSNLVKNRGFELGTAADWTTSGTTSIASSGACRNKFSAQAGPGSGLYQSLPVVAGLTYTLGGYGKVSVNGKTGWIGMKVKDSAGTVLMDRNVSFTSQSCRQKKVSLITPANAATIQIYLWSDSNGANLLADDILLHVTPNKLDNYGFETGDFTDWPDDWGNSQVVNTGARTGTYALQISAAGGGRTQPMSGMIGSPWGAEFTLTASGKVAVSSEYGLVGMKIYGSLGTVVDAKLNFNSTGYSDKAAQVIYTPKPGELVTEAYVYVWKASGTGTFTADDIHLTSFIGTPNGLWTWVCDTCTVQFNEGYDTDSPGGDGGVYDIDWGNTNNVVQYNYGHDAGSYCVAVFGAHWTTTGSVVRYNVCSNNGRRAEGARAGDLHFQTWDGGSIAGMAIYNNTFVWNPVVAGTPIVTDGRPGWRPVYTGSEARFIKNNIFYSTVPELVDVTSNINLDHNLYWYTGAASPKWMYNEVNYSAFAAYQAGSGQDPNGLYADPLLNNPTYHGTGMPTTQLTLQNGSPAIDAGIDVGNMGTRDFYGNTIPNGADYDIGAHER
jgi:hypothetical protein